MKKIFSYPLLMIGGAVIFTLVHDFIGSMLLNQKMNLFTTSDNQERLYQTAIDFLNHPKYSIAIFHMIGANIDGKRPTNSARLAGLDAIRDFDYTTSIPFTIICATNNPDPRIRQQALSIYEFIVNRTYTFGMGFLLKKLEFESDRELQERKLELVCRYLCLDKAKVLEQIEKDGIAATVSSLLERLPSSVSDQAELEVRGTESERVN